MRIFMQVHLRVYRTTPGYAYLLQGSAICVLQQDDLRSLGGLRRRSLADLLRLRCTGTRRLKP
jgi:hypothetical protein